MLMLYSPTARTGVTKVRLVPAVPTGTTAKLKGVPVVHFVAAGNLVDPSVAGVHKYS